MKSILKKKRVATILLVVFAVLIISVALLIRYANVIIKSELERRLGDSFSVRSVNISWGRVQASEVGFNGPSGKPIIRVEKLSLSPSLVGLLKKEYVISTLKLDKPHFFIEQDKSGKITAPVLPLRTETKKKTDNEIRQDMVPFTIKNVEIADGSLDYLDRRASTPVLLKLRDIEFVINEIHVPVIDVVSKYKLSCATQGRTSNGKVKSEGKVNLGRKDADYNVQIRSFDLTDVKPYVEKHSSANLTNGLLDVDIRGGMMSNKIDASGSAVLKDLRFGGRGNQFLGVPLTLVIGMLEKNNNEIPVAFKIRGSLDNPKFSLQEQFMASMAIALADKLGFSIQSLGEALLGTKESDRKSGIDILEFGKGLQKIFGR